jgi:cytochrome c biogenesis protein CcmG/thiol:disulfide interchange protein DsbE
MTTPAFFQRFWPAAGITSLRRNAMRKHGHELVLSLLIVSLIAAFGGALSLSFRHTKTTPDAASRIHGTPVPAFELQDLDGKIVRPQDFRGKVVLVNFWGTTCAPCLTEIPWLVDFQKRYGPKGLAVLAISMYGEGPDVLRPFVAEHGMTDFKVVMGSQKTTELFGGVYGFPHTFVVDTQGKFVSTHAGIINRKEVEAELAALLDNPRLS